MSVLGVVLGPKFTSNYSPAFDPGATVSNNVIDYEIQVLSANFGSDVQFIVPSFAPFFASSFHLYYIDTNNNYTELHAGSDFFFAFPFISATRALNVPIYSGIVLANNQLAGNFSLLYHTLGGVWVNTPAINQAVEIRNDVDPYVTAWEQVVNYNQVFPNVNGAWDKTDPASMADVITAILGIEKSVQQSALSGLSQSMQGLTHIYETDNPHVDNAASVGLGNVSNYPPASHAQAIDSTNDATYIRGNQLYDIFQKNLPAAQDTLAGIFKLNDASNLPADGSDAAKVVTAHSFNVLVSTQNNPVYSAFNRSQRTAYFTPYPFTFPRTWNGSQYTSMTTLLQAISNLVGVYPLEFNSNNGSIWFPPGVALLSLAVS